MSDILLDRIKAHRSAPDVYDAPTFNAMADRIEELEARCLANRVSIMRLEAKLAKAVEFAEIVERCGHGALWDLARTTLAELKGETDE